MAKTFEYSIIFGILLNLVSRSNGICSCETSKDTLQCILYPGNLSLTVDCRLDDINRIEILYSNSVNIDLNIPVGLPVKISPQDNVDSPKLQIKSLNTNSSDINIYVTVSASTNNDLLFTQSSISLAPNAMLTVRINQIVNNLGGYSIFPNDSTVNIPQYAVIFENAPSNPGLLELAKIFTGRQSSNSLKIIGKQHTFTINTSLPTCNLTSLTSLTLKNLRLSERVLDCFPNITSYTVESCSCDGIAFLESKYKYTSSLTLQSNSFINPNIRFADAFTSFTGFSSLTIVDQQLNSSVLQGISQKPLRNFHLELKNYGLNDFNKYMSYSPVVRSIEIYNLQTLSVLPSLFFNSMDRLNEVLLVGDFALNPGSICTFVAVNKMSESKNTKITLSSSKQDSSDWDICAAIYVMAINQYTTNNFRCPPFGRYIDCEALAKTAEKCELSKYDDVLCGQNIYNRSNLFKYAGSPLDILFKNVTENPTNRNNNDDDGGSNRVVPVIIALSVLLCAIAIFIVTVFFIRRQRRQRAALINQPNVVYKEAPPPNYNDLSHISIATTRTTKSMYPALDQSMFPAAHPSDQIAPPLYTAPSESYPVMNVNKQKGALSAAHRDSILTQNTHVYETVDS